MCMNQANASNRGESQAQTPIRAYLHQAEVLTSPRLISARAAHTHTHALLPAIKHTRYSEGRVIRVSLDARCEVYVRRLQFYFRSGKHLFSLFSLSLSLSGSTKSVSCPGTPDACLKHAAARRIRRACTVSLYASLAFRW